MLLRGVRWKTYCCQTQPRRLGLKVTVVIPFHKNLTQLSQSLSAVRRSLPDAQVVVAADGAIEDCGPLARQLGAEVVVVPGPSGPAVARNRAAAVATGDVLAFVDTDVVVAPDAISGMCRLLEDEPGIAGVFGAYDHAPAEPNFMSQYKNLSHAYVHEIGSTKASTFWAGLGVVRRAAFVAVGGFDERFPRPSVEDIDLGYRLVSAGYALRLDVRFRGKHLKRWTLWNSIVTDIQARGLPWTQLIHRFQALSNDLNTSIVLRLSVVLAYAALACVALSFFTGWAVVGLVLALGGFVGLNWDYYRWFAAKRGLWFALRVVPAHLIHCLCNGVSFVAGTALHLGSRAGFDLPGALPAGAWTRHLGSGLPREGA